MTVSPDFIINGVNIPSPTEHQWIFPESIGIDGRGVDRLMPFYSYDLSWNALTHDEYHTLYTIWQGSYNSGTSSINLPKINASSYQFYTYSGAIIDAPKINGAYNQNYITGVKMRIRKISV